MILKVLLIAAVIGVVYFLFIKKKPSTKSQSQKRSDSDLKTNDMEVCASCGVYVDIDEAILSGTNYYCSRECLSEGK